MRLRRRLVQQPPDMLVQGASGRRLQIVAIGRQHFVKRVGRGENHLGDQARVLLGEFRSEHVF